MKCNLDAVIGLIAGAIAALVAAIVLAYYWSSALPLFVAAALVAGVSFGFIPGLKNALVSYASCRGSSRVCSISYAINTLGQIASIISLVGFAIAGALQVTALAFISSVILAWLGVTLEAAVAVLVYSGISTCGASMLLLAGVLTNALTFKSCMDRQDAEGRRLGRTSA